MNRSKREVGKSGENKGTKGISRDCTLFCRDCPELLRDTATSGKVKGIEEKYRANSEY